MLLSQGISAILSIVIITICYLGSYLLNDGDIKKTLSVILATVGSIALIYLCLWCFYSYQMSDHEF